MTQDAAGGHRRLDRVLADGYLADLAEISLAEVRARRADVEQEEVDISYLRRLVQGRVDIIRAELARRSEGAEGSLLADLPHILGDAERGTPHGLGRHAAVEPSRADEHRRRVEQLVADVDLSDVTARTDDELQATLGLLTDAEAELSAKRHALHDVLDRCSGEIARRYRDGEADVSDLLAAQPPGS